MEEAIRRFRAAAGQHRGARRRRRYSIEAREAAVEYARIRQGDGATVHRAAAELRLPMVTLQAWMREAGPVFRRVAVAPVASVPAALVVRMPSGLSVEGLDLAGVVALARALEPR